MTVYLRNGVAIMNVDPADIQSVSRKESGWVAVLKTCEGYRATAIASWQGPKLKRLVERR